MTNFDKIMAVATPNWLAYLMARTTPCDKCPAKRECKHNKQEITEYKCVRFIKHYLESEAEK